MLISLFDIEANTQNLKFVKTRKWEAEASNPKIPKKGAIAYHIIKFVKLVMDTLDENEMIRHYSSNSI